MDFILECREEHYLVYHRFLDELAAIEASTRADAQRLKQHAPNNLVAYRHFFQKVPAPRWLKPLSEEGSFNYPLAPEFEGDLIRFSPLPQSQYLMRMARPNPPAVVDIILGIPATENINVLTDLAGAACQMPAEEAIRLVDTAELWTKTPYVVAHLLPDSLGRLVAHLAEGGRSDEALDLARSLLTVRLAARGTTVQSPELSQYLSTRPEEYFRDWQYKEILGFRVSVLMRAAGVQSLCLLCNLPNEAVAIAQGPEGAAISGRDVQEGLSSIWISTFGRTVEKSHSEFLNQLVTAVRDAAEQVVRDEPSLLSEVIEAMEGYHWVIFKRLVPHLLCIF